MASTGDPQFPSMDSTSIFSNLRIENMNRINRKKGLAESMINPHKTGPYSCSLKLETNSILLIKLRAIFKVSSDEDLSDAICKHLNEFARSTEQKDLEKRLVEMEKNEI